MKNDSHKGFEFRVLNELFDDNPHSFRQLEGSSFLHITERAQASSNDIANVFVQKFLEYELTVVLLSECYEHSEFNLQFARLNLGVAINSGEKLNAMVGDLRDVCFDDLGRHGFLEVVSIPERRFAREQTAAQILAQVFACERGRDLYGGVEYVRTRHFDLQRLFKRFTNMADAEREWVERVRTLLSLLEAGRAHFSFIRSRAFLVSIVLLAYLRNIETEREVEELGTFVEEFLLRVKWQIRKGLDVDPEYRFLVEFQRNVTQASVERPAVAARAKVLGEEFRRWLEGQALKGDREYEERMGEPASVKCRRELGV